MDAPQTTDDTSSDSAEELGGDLKSASFVGLLVTQLLGATNDNTLRWLAIGIGKQYVQPGGVANILMAGTACFVLPYLLLAAPAGYLADRFSKRKVIVACKIAEVAIMVLAIAAILLGSLWMLFVIVALMGAQSALFGPSKLGSIPEMLRAEKLSAANGLMGLTTVCATMTGTAVGNVLTDVTGTKGQERWWLSAIVLIGMAAVGWGTSLLVARLPAASPRRKFPWDAPQQTWRDLKTLYANGPLMRVALGIVFFWSLGALAQLNIDQFAFEGGATVQQQVVPLLVSLVIGVGLGSVLAGIWSGGRIELGILPLGAGGMVLGAALLFLVQGTLVDPASIYTWSYYLACFFLFLLGTSAGMFDVPLAAFMQHRSPRETRGSILAASNFLTFTGILLVALLFAGLRAPLRPGSLEHLLTGDASHDAEVTDLWEEISALAASSSAAVAELDADSIADSFPGQADLARDVVAQLSGLPLFSAGQIFLLCGAMTVPVFWYIIWRIPQASLRFFVWLATRTIYRVRVQGRENLPAEGGALLAANHVSWLDAFLLLGTSSRPLRILVDADLIRGGLAGWLARTTDAIPIRRTPKALRAALDEARAAVADGQLVCIFPEGTMTRDGQLQAFKPGLMEIVRESDVPVVPVYLDELWGSIFSFEGGRFFWKWPQRWPGRVSIWFGPPLTRPDDVESVHDAVEQLGAEAVQKRNGQVLLPQRFLRQCRRKRFTSKVADSSGMELTGGSLLMRTLIARRLLNRDVLDPDERFVGILLPPSVGGVVTNAAIALDGRVSANLNYTLSADVLNDCIAQAGIRHVLTSRRVMEKLEVELDAELVYLEDFRERVTLFDKLRAALLAQLLPLRLLERLLGVRRLKGDDTFTVIFTSGSTGRPKGVLLSQTNVLFNVEAIDEVIHLRSDDVVVGILPFFHSFGFSVPLWTVLGTDIKGVYHFNPLDARQVGKLCGQHRGTILLGTPTFLRSYQRRCSTEDFGTLDVVVAGAEKMPIDLAAAFEKKYGVRPVEGYGATELAPLVSVNVPPSRNPAGDEGVREGTVGRAVPGVRARVVDPDTLEDLPAGTPGMLLVTGPNVMQGYLNEPEKTADVIRDGWYVTGDIVRIDDAGFIEITGRLSRFSKIGGEMVPHVRIEEELLALVGHDDEEEDDGGEAPLPLAVTAVPDARKGERLIVLYTRLPDDPEAICRRLADAGLPNLWIPSPESFYRVEQIPVLGTGKLDLQGVKQAAREEAEKG